MVGGGAIYITTAPTPPLGALAKAPINSTSPKRSSEAGHPVSQGPDLATSGLGWVYDTSQTEIIDLIFS